MAKSNGTDQLIDSLEGVFAKLPNLPKNYIGAIVNIIPWIALIFGILGLLASLVGFGILTALSPFVAVFVGGIGVAGGNILASLLYVLSSALLLAAFQGVRARKASGWNLLFWSEMVSVISAVASVSGSGILFGAVGLYILFQIRSSYK